MIKIIFVKTSDTKKSVKIGIDNDGESVTLTLSAGVYTSLGSPLRGDTVDEYTYEEMKREDESYRALKRAIGYLSLSDKSRYALYSKLREAGFSREASEGAASECISLGYLDEARQLERLVETEANYKLRGRYYIKRKLAAKGYRASDIDRAISLLVESGDVDFDHNFEKLAEKRGAETEEERHSLRYRFGYKI